MRRVVLMLIGLMLLISATGVHAAFDPAENFDKKCSSCHTIGGGALKGPDLKGVTTKRKQDWLIKFIQSSYTMIQSGDADAIKIYNEFNKTDMPDQRLTDAEVVELLKFIEGGGQVSAGTSNIKSVSKATPDDVLKGEALYLGIVPLANGGPSCASCHSVGDSGLLGGGTLAKDLTHIFPTYGDKGMNVALQKLAFPVMDEVFLGKSLTEDEIFQLKAFLSDADEKGVLGLGYQRKFVFLGICGLVVVMGIIDFVWRKRRKDSVRKSEGGIR